MKECDGESNRTVLSIQYYCSAKHQGKKREKKPVLHIVISIASAPLPWYQTYAGLRLAVPANIDLKEKNSIGSAPRKIKSWTAICYENTVCGK